jgi:predicted DNA-binding transcriptional regulator AlpA
MHQQYLTDADLAKRYSISRATVWRWSNSGRLPPPVRLGEATTRWPLEAVLEHEQRLERQRSRNIA